MNFGARVYFYDGGRIQIAQTIRRDGKGPYVLDTDRTGTQKVEYIAPGNDQAKRVLDALRRAQRGRMTN